MKLLSKNPKVEKGEKAGYLTYILHLAPADLSGYQVCPMAELAGCKEACLNTAGRGGIIKTGEDSNTIQRARIRKTRMFFERRDLFMEWIVADIQNAIRQAEKKGMQLAIRLNGTSDIAWEKIRVGAYRNIMEVFPEVIFYDYTKIAGRKTPNNYSLTYSLGARNRSHALREMERGTNVAVVFRERATMPKAWAGLTVIDGDETDLRFTDPKGVVVGLYAKGKAKKDMSGFVVDVA